MSRRGAVVLGFVLAVAILSPAAGPALAWTPIASGNPTWCGTVPYSMHEAGSPDLGLATSETEVQRGMDDWSRVSCTGLTTRYVGRTARVPGTYEGTSVVGWIESGWRHGSGAIGVTGPRWGSCIIEADMELNGVNYGWQTGSGTPGNVNAYSIILHEAGHYYGLGHSSDRAATMYYAYSGGIATLNSDDQNGICALYPGSGGSDCTTTGCPAGQECVDRTCRTITGDGSLCSPCSSGSDCGTASDFCLRYPDGAGYCGKACGSSADCGTGGQCVSVSGYNQCIRVNAAGSPDCSSSPMPGCRTDSDCAAHERCNAGTCETRPTGGANLGEPCAADGDCNTGTCFFTGGAGVCIQSCDWLDTGSCPAGFYCDGDATGACGSGVCLAGGAGAGALGAACTTDTDCASIFCSLGVCATPCIPGGAATCPDGYSCQIGTSAACGACKTSGATGSACETNEDCSSRICAIDGDRTFCTELCTDASTCPEGFTCEPAGETSVCAPPAGGGDRSSRGGCCSVAAGAKAGHGPGQAWLLALFALLPLLRRLRRRRPGRRGSP